jgi:hypothetical protein
MIEQVTQQVAVVSGIGLAVSPLVYAAVTVMRGMVGAHKRRRIILPLGGICAGWAFVGLVLTAVGADVSGASASLALLGGFEAFAISAGLSAQGKDARR